MRYVVTSPVQILNETVTKMKSDGFTGVGLFVGQNEDATHDDLAQGALEHLAVLNAPDFTPSEETL